VGPESTGLGQPRCLLGHSETPSAAKSRRIWRHSSRMMRSCLKPGETTTEWLWTQSTANSSLVRGGGIPVFQGKNREICWLRWPWSTTVWLVLWTFQLLSSCLRGVSSREFLCPNREFARACREPPTTTVVATAKMGVSFAASSSIRRPRRIATGQRSPAERLLRSARIARSALDGRGISIANRKRMQAGYTETGSTWPIREAEDVHRWT